jgi:hypothetical protein
MRWGKHVHCAIIVVEKQKKYLVDPGYLMNKPMELDLDHPRLYQNPFSGVEISFDRRSETYHLTTFNNRERKWRYSFKDRLVPLQEFLKYWHDSFMWNSMHGLCLTKVVGGKRIYIHKAYMQESSYAFKHKTNIKHQVHNTIHRIFSIDPQFTEEALAAVETNMSRERESGLWTPT